MMREPWTTGDKGAKAAARRSVSGAPPPARAAGKEWSSLFSRL